MAKKNPIQAAADLIGNVEKMKATKEIAQPGTPGTELTDTPVTPIDPMARPLWEIDSIFIDPYKPIPPVKTWAIIGGRRAIYKKGIIAFSAKPKQGKSTAIYTIIQLLIEQRLFGNLTPLEKPNLAIVFDTEMDVDTLTERAKAIADSLRDECKRFLIVPLKMESKRNRIPIIERVTKQYNPDIVVIDQVAKLIADVNDSKESNDEFGEWLNQYANDRTVFTVIHQNKGENDTKMKGHAGSILEELCTEYYTVENDKGMFKVSLVEDRRGKSEADPFLFALDDDRNLISTTDIIRQQEEKNRDTWIAYFNEIFGEDHSLSSAEVKRRVEKKDCVKDRQAYERINAAINCGALQKEKDKNNVNYKVLKG